VRAVGICPRLAVGRHRQRLGAVGARCADCGKLLRDRRRTEGYPVVAGLLDRKATSAEYCYRDAHFTLSQRDIESGRQLAGTGFALGNFNYRIDSIDSKRGVRRQSSAATRDRRLPWDSAARMQIRSLPTRG